MKLNIVFIPSKKDFRRGDKQLITEIIRLHAGLAAKALRFRPEKFTFTVYPWERNSVHAFTQAKDWVRVTINPKQFVQKKHRKAMIERLIYIVYHEMHHAARGYAGFLPPKKWHILMNSIISEGLADIFVKEQYPIPYTSKVTKYSFKQIKKWFPKLSKIKWRRELFKDPWLKGGEGKPKRLGYKVGRYIVESVKKSRPKLTAAKMVSTDAKKVLRWSKVKI